jgi:acetoin utilization deacetylase AcuC-like enzyme
VAILDVDYHHGNGTQAIFYDRPDVLVLSLHADPSDDFPLLPRLARRDRRGPGRGLQRELRPSPPAPGFPAWREALDDALAKIAPTPPTPSWSPWASTPTRTTRSAASRSRATTSPPTAA